MMVMPYSSGISEPMLRTSGPYWMGNQYGLTGVSNAPKRPTASAFSLEVTTNRRQVDILAGATVPVIVHPKTFELVEIDPHQAWYWTREWQQMEREVDADLANGDFEEFEDLDSFFSSL